MKNQKGITMIALLITVIVLILLTGVSLGTGYTLIKNVRIGRIISNMALVKAKSETIYEQYQFNNEVGLIGGKAYNIDFVSEEEIAIIEQETGKAGFESWTWYQWDADTLRSQGLDADLLGEDECFYINYENAEILYNRGTSYSSGDTKYFSLTGLNYLYENN